jgi:hypothetical protein
LTLRAGTASAQSAIPTSRLSTTSFASIRGDGILVKDSTNAGGTTTTISGNQLLSRPLLWRAPDGSGISVYSSNHVIADNNFVAQHRVGRHPFL